MTGCKNLTRARSRWGAIANPHAKVFDSPSTPQSHPGACPWQQNENSVQYVFYLLFVRTHTKFGIKIFEIDMLMIFDLLTSPQGHQFDRNSVNNAFLRLFRYVRTGHTMTIKI